MLPQPGDLLCEPYLAKVPALWTHHGFVDDVVRFLQEQGVAYEVTDARLPKPAPNLSAMFGFRFSQQALLEQALRQRRSGLIGAPTRFGKTTLIVNTCRAYRGLRILVVVPGKDLVKQTYETLTRDLPDMEVVKVKAHTKAELEDGVVTYSAKNLGRDITVCSMDSMHKIDASMIDLVLVDEPHALPTDGRMPDFVRFDKALKLGYGATLEGRFDGRDPMIKGLIGPVLAERTYLEAVAEGAIAPITVLAVEIPLTFKRAWNRATAYKRALWEAPFMEHFLPWFMSGCADRNGVPLLPLDWQILSFIVNEDQVKFLRNILNAHGLRHVMAMDKIMTTKEREKAMEDMASGAERLGFATGIWAQGVTFSQLRVMVNLAGGGCSTSTVQKPGRVAEIIPGKKCGIVVDFNFTADRAELGKAKAFENDSCFQPVWESQSRMSYYKSKGFNVIEVSGYDSMIRALREHCL